MTNNETCEENEQMTENETKWNEMIERTQAQGIVNALKPTIIRNVQKLKTEENDDR